MSITHYKGERTGAGQGVAVYRSYPNYVGAPAACGEVRVDTQTWQSVITKPARPEHAGLHTDARCVSALVFKLRKTGREVAVAKPNGAPSLPETVLFVA